MGNNKPRQATDLRQSAESNGHSRPVFRKLVPQDSAGMRGFVVWLPKEPLFVPETVVVGPDVQQTLTAQCVSQCFMRHITGDWGNLGEKQQMPNGVALDEGAAVDEGVELVSEFTIHTGMILRFVTDCDRLQTVVTLMSDDLRPAMALPSGPVHSKQTNQHTQPKDTENDR